jgi:hypothetical protein
MNRGVAVPGRSLALPLPVLDRSHAHSCDDAISGAGSGEAEVAWVGILGGVGKGEEAHQ